MLKTKKILLLSVLIPTILISSLSTARASDRIGIPAAKSALLIEVDSGKVLFEYNKDEQQPADALVKVMTLLIAVTACQDGAADPDDLVTMTSDAWADLSSSSTTRGIKTGEEMTLLDLMYCAFTGSANEAANMVAIHIAGSIDTFVGMMNERAKAIGCTNTNFTNPHGQYDANQYTTAFDQYIIYHEALSYPLFEEISSAFRHNTEILDSSRTLTVTSANNMLNSGSKYYYRHCVSGLASAVLDDGTTGASYEGGHSSITMAETDTLSLIAVVLGSDVVLLNDNSTERRNLTEAQRLFEYGFSQFSWRAIISTDELVTKTSILHGDGADFVILRPESEIRDLLDNDIPDEEFIRTITIFSEVNGETLSAPITAGDVLGEVTISRNGTMIGTVRLVASTSIGLHRFQYIKNQVANALSSTVAQIIIWVLVVVVALYAALVVRYNVIRSKRKRRNMEARQKLVEERQNPNQTQGSQNTRL